jgi:hypothetical protein
MPKTSKTSKLLNITKLSKRDLEIKEIRYELESFVVSFKPYFDRISDSNPEAKQVSN